MNWFPIQMQMVCSGAELFRCKSKWSKLDSAFQVVWYIKFSPETIGGATWARSFNSKTWKAPKNYIFIGDIHKACRTIHSEGGANACGTSVTTRFVDDLEQQASFCYFHEPWNSVDSTFNFFLKGGEWMPGALFVLLIMNSAWARELWLALIMSRSHCRKGHGSMLAGLCQIETDDFVACVPWIVLILRINKHLWIHLHTLESVTSDGTQRQKF